MEVPGGQVQRKLPGVFSQPPSHGPRPWRPAHSFKSVPLPINQTPATGKLEDATIPAQHRRSLVCKHLVSHLNQNDGSIHLADNKIRHYFIPQQGFVCFATDSALETEIRLTHARAAGEGLLEAGRAEAGVGAVGVETKLPRTAGDLLSALVQIAALSTRLTPEAGRTRRQATIAAAGVLCNDLQIEKSNGENGLMTPHGYWRHPPQSAIAKAELTKAGAYLGDSQVYLTLLPIRAGRETKTALVHVAAGPVGQESVALLAARPAGATPPTRLVHALLVRLARRQPLTALVHVPSTHPRPTDPPDTPTDSEPAAEIWRTTIVQLIAFKCGGERNQPMTIHGGPQHPSNDL